MGKPSEVKKQRRALKKKAEREKEKRRAIATVASKSPRQILRESGQWPLLECLVSENWQDTTQLTQIVVARQAPDGQVAAGVFLIDLACLGVKDGFARLFPSRREYERQLRSRIEERQAMKKADLNLAAKIIREATHYAAELGFRPHPDSADAMLVLGEANPDACDVPIPLGGPEGKPLYVAGPYDNVQAIMNRLLRKLGPDGFHYVVMLRDKDSVWEAEE